MIYSGATLLADGTQAGGMVVDLNFNGEGLKQVQQIFRASEIVVFNRGNKQNTVSFGILHLHANLASSLERAVTESDTLPAVADLTISYSDAAGSITATLSAAGWGPISRTTSGMTSIKKYQVIGGTFNVTTGGVSGGLNVIDGGTATVSMGTASGGTIDGGNATDTYIGETVIDGGNA